MQDTHNPSEHTKTYFIFWQTNFLNQGVTLITEIFH